MKGLTSRIISIQFSKNRWLLNQVLDSDPIDPIKCSFTFCPYRVRFLQVGHPWPLFG